VLNWLLLYLPLAVLAGCLPPAADEVGAWILELFTALLPLLVLLPTPDLLSRGETLVRAEVLLQGTGSKKQTLLENVCSLSMVQRTHAIDMQPASSILK
jgi:hypothetical protein